MLWALIALRRRPLGSLRGVAAGAALGLVGYSVQAGLYFGALERIDAGLASLLLYAYPALVTVGGDRAAPRAAQPPQARRARRSPRAASRSCSSAAARRDRRRPAWRSARRAVLLHVLHPRVGPRRRRHAALPFAASVATGAAVTVASRAARRGHQRLARGR